MSSPFRTHLYGTAQLEASGVSVSVGTPTLMPTDTDTTRALVLVHDAIYEAAAKISLEIDDLRRGLCNELERLSDTLFQVVSKKF